MFEKTKISASSAEITCAQAFDIANFINRVAVGANAGVSRSPYKSDEISPSLTLQAVAESHRIGCWGCWTCPYCDGITTGWANPSKEFCFVTTLCARDFYMSMFFSKFCEKCLRTVFCAEV